MTEENDGTINLFEELGVSDKRAHEINVEIHTIADNSKYLTELIGSIPETYDRESIILGVFLCEIIMKSNSSIVVLPQQAKKILDEIIEDVKSKLEGSEIQPKGDPKNN